MGSIPEIGYDKYPEQGSFLLRPVKVCFNYDTKQTVLGTCIRDDLSEPFVTVFQLFDGRVVLASECQYTYA